MDITKNRNYLIASMVIFYGSSLISGFYPNTPNKFSILLLLAFFIVFRYYKLHLSMYYNYSKVFFMSIFVFFGTYFTIGILGLIINIYCIVKANKLIKSQDNVNL